MAEMKANNTAPFTRIYSLQNTIIKIMYVLMLEKIGWLHKVTDYEPAHCYTV